MYVLSSVNCCIKWLSLVIVSSFVSSSVVVVLLGSEYQNSWSTKTNISKHNMIADNIGKEDNGRGHEFIFYKCIYIHFYKNQNRYIMSTLLHAVNKEIIIIS